jgi:hypothetical protein
VPVLARTLEAAGLSTVLVTMMPFWTERIGVPRTLGVEFPFAQTLGRPHAVNQQMRVICQALTLLGTAEAPGKIIHSPEEWPQPLAQAQKEWQPDEPSPIIREMAPRIREILRARRRSSKPSSSDKTET